MAKKSNIWAKVGVWSFVAGLVIAALAAVFIQNLSGWLIVVLAALGIIVGLLNITDSEVTLFLLASLVFLMAAASIAPLAQLFGNTVGTWVVTFLAGIIAFVAPAAFVVSLVALYHIARDA